ncbi:MAG: NTP transferase domain-containing protein, partial [Candidatus Omnitrophica bacterium]|nr:NTP transferase domain-containing protein [Candidatus Omnitrophota bacterium]
MKDCDCVILCGGLGARLQSVVKDVPKVMAEVNGAPLLDLMIEHLKKQGAARIVLCTGYQAEAVENYYREHDFGMVIDFSREEEPLGTGGAVK